MNELMDFITLDARPENEESDSGQIHVNELFEQIKTEINQINIRATYPFSEKFYYTSELKRVNFEERCEQMIRDGDGFVIGKSQKIEKEIKSEDGIFSPRYGNTLKDLNLFMDKYRCKCGVTRHKINEGIECPICHGIVERRDDNYKMTGWLILQKYRVISPAAFRSIAFLCGNDTLDHMIKLYDPVDEDGHPIPLEEDLEYQRIISGPKAEPYYGIGMTKFQEKFDEIMRYYLDHASNKESKKKVYDDIMSIRDRVFTNCIPVYTTLLRPFELHDKKKFTFEGTNAIYNMMSKYVTRINANRLRIDRNWKKKQTQLYNLQLKWMKLDDEINAILSGKKGKIRQLFCGRYTFSSRSVIVQNPELRIDEVKLPYKALHELLFPRIINVLRITYGMTPNEAYNIWYQAKITPDKRIVKIIKSLIMATDRGLPLLINRNPTIALGSILQMFCVGMTDEIDEDDNIVQKESVLQVPLQILDLMAADFDGDVLNIYLITNKAFFTRSFQVFNPANTMYVSPNDGLLNIDVMHQRDSVINMNTLINLGRPYYSQEQLDRIMQYKNYKEPKICIERRTIYG